MATLWAFAVAGCARGAGDLAPDDAGIDARSPDAPPAVLPDAAPDAPADAPSGCAISANAAPVLDGSADLDDFAMEQRLAPGAMLGTDAVAITWDQAKLYVTVASTAFDAEYEPLHLYVEAATTALATPTPAAGKEYSGLVPTLPFSPTHLIAARRNNGVDLYDGVYAPAAGWTTKATALDPGTHVFVAADHHALSVAVPWSSLGGCPHALRVALHVVHAIPANEWKVLVPASHTPWLAPGGGYYEVDLTAPSAISGWVLR